MWVHRKKLLGPAGFTPIWRPYRAKMCFFGHHHHNQHLCCRHHHRIGSVSLVERRGVSFVIRTNLPRLLAQSCFSSIPRGRILYEHEPHKIAHNLFVRLWRWENTIKQIYGGVCDDFLMGGVGPFSVAISFSQLWTHLLYILPPKVAHRARSSQGPHKDTLRATG